MILLVWGIGWGDRIWTSAQLYCIFRPIFGKNIFLLCSHAFSLKPLWNKTRNITTFMFKTKHGLQPKNISDLFQQKMSKYKLRNNDFQVQRFKTVQYEKHSLRYIGPALWAKLPKETRYLKTLGTLKKHIRNLNLKELIRDQGGCGSLCNLCSKWNFVFYNNIL